MSYGIGYPVASSTLLSLKCCKHVLYYFHNLCMGVRRGWQAISCAHVRAHRGRETSAHKKLGAHICSLQNCFCTYFIHVIPNSDEFTTGEVLHRKIFYVHTYLKNLEGTLVARGAFSPLDFGNVVLNVLVI